MTVPMQDQAGEAELLQRCLGGDSAAWEEFLERYRPVLEGAVRFTFLRCVYRIPHADVENVVQDLLARLYEQDCRRLRSYQGRCPFAAWLKSLAVRMTLNTIRDEKRRGRYGGGEIEDLALRAAPEGGELPAPEEREEIRRLDALLDSLGPLQRTALKMFYYDGLSYRQISLSLGIPVQTLGSLITRARARLKEMLGAR
ncbi:MAG: sigma-70 family RNA polymerase sigma factor [Planctomycetes bacterium]|nr:sigma-70 family RNA polymerase sigma factor [Planctomycetota bacterium]